MEADFICCGNYVFYGDRFWDQTAEQAKCHWYLPHQTMGVLQVNRASWCGEFSPRMPDRLWVAPGKSERPS